ncbi:MAG TPA: PQQ-dependent dehydrogenase, methanol/ethanol family [Gemmatimonadaceae bacterium]|nr:PQQ-dependent dehydrogenase, methanol/ethanol family [Gemmatimonadaceae bacterium]
MRITRLMTIGAGWAVLAATAQGQEQVKTTTRQAAGEPTFTEVTNQMLLNARNDGKNWVTYGRDYMNQRWSPLTQINTSNVKNLRVSWMHQTGISRLGSFETSPIVVDGVMYLTTPYNTAIAVDARTGRQIWRYEHKPSIASPIFCCGPNNRGVAISGGTLYMGTLDARLVALDAKTGKVNWDVEIADPEAGYSETMAPLIIDNMVIVGISGAEYGIRGFVRAYDKNDGKQIWNFYTLPDKGWEGNFATHTNEGDDLKRDIAAEKAAMSQYGDAWQRGGGSVWMTPAYDPETHMLYFAVGNPSPDLDGSVRPGDNLYTESIVAIDARTGEYKWHYQEVPHDVWDLDATSPVVIVKLKNGKKAVAEAGKTAYVYILDAATGKLIKRSDEFNRHENYFTQPTAEGARMLPGANGGSEWSPPAVNPTLGYMYVLGLEQPMHYITHSAPLEKGKLWLGSAFKAVPGERQYGTFTAINLNTGKRAWQVETEQPMIGGALATAGNLVFTGEGNGHFNAYDARTGKVLWTFQGGAGCNAPPVTYMLSGKQYIAVACGGNYQLGYPLGDAVLVFALPGGTGTASQAKK